VNIVQHLFIVGAGFSASAGLPLTSQFTEKLLDVENLKLDGPSSLQVEFLKKFVFDAFGVTPETPVAQWPELEDIFTCIDLSANSGHHLGPNYSPSQLRTVRRALIVRIIRMLRQSYARRATDFNEPAGRLQHLLRAVDKQNAAFLSMNWDTVIERGLRTAQRIYSYDYGCNALAASFPTRGAKIQRLGAAPEIQVLKPHGSVNWLYCDSCRQIFWFPPGSDDKIAAQLFHRSDWDVVKKIIGKTYSGQAQRRRCPECSAYALGTRFATFSYRKALDFPMHESTWRTAEELLREADNWIFIGYSLPPADYEFKLLLKRVLLSRKRKPRLTVITGGDAGAVERTKLSYVRFFGEALNAKRNIFASGLDSGAIDGLEKIGAINRIPRFDKSSSGSKARGQAFR